MKKSIPFLLLLLSALCFRPMFVSGQPATTLRVFSMPGYPDLPADTAYEGQLYSFTVGLINGSNIVVNTTIEIQLKADSVETTIATSNPQPSLAPGDTLLFTVTGYGFDQTKYQAGNNIVVVWPRVNGQVLPIDSFTTNVFFVPLNSLGDGLHDFKDLYFNSFPVPSADFISFAGMENKAFEYVRIYSLTGALVMEEIKPANQRLFIGYLPAGSYFLEVGAEGRAYRSKFVRM